MKKRKKQGIIFKVKFLLILDQILFIVDQTISILKKDRKMYLRLDSTVFRSNSTVLDQIPFF